MLCLTSSHNRATHSSPHTQVMAAFGDGQGDLLSAPNVF